MAQLEVQPVNLMPLLGVAVTGIFAGATKLVAVPVTVPPDVGDPYTNMLPSKLGVRGALSWQPAKLHWNIVNELALPYG
jgi:hypothetical protein